MSQLSSGSEVTYREEARASGDIEKGREREMTEGGARERERRIKGARESDHI
jgi:hypothetical protein